MSLDVGGLLTHDMLVVIWAARTVGTHEAVGIVAWRAQKEKLSAHVLLILRASLFASQPPLAWNYPYLSRLYKCTLSGRPWST